MSKTKAQKNWQSNGKIPLNFSSRNNINGLGFNGFRIWWVIIKDKSKVDSLISSDDRLWI